MEEKLPKGWIKVQLGDILKVTSGINLTKKNMIADGEFPVFGGNGIIGNHNDFNVETPTIIIGRVGYYCGSLHLTPNKAWVTDNAFITIFPENLINKKFIFHLLKYLDLRNYSSSTAQPVISGKSIYPIEFLLPPLMEQNRIVKKLDVAFEKLQWIEKAFEETNEDSINIVDSLLQQGKYERLEPHLIERTEKIGVEWKGLRLIGVHAKDGVVDLRVGAKKSFENYKIVKKGDFLYNPMRVNIGSIAYYEGKENALTSPDYVVFTVKEYLSPLLLFRYLKSARGLAEISRSTQGSVRQRLYFKNLINVKYPKISGEKQKEANEILEWYRKLRFLRKELTTELKKIKNSLLQKAFKGELVHQDYREESASMLLEKIREDKKQREEKIKVQRKKRRPTTKKRIIMNNLELLEVLKINGKPMTADEVWRKSKYKEDIEAFYEQLRHEVEIVKNIRSTIETDQITYLSLIENGK